MVFAFLAAMAAMLSLALHARGLPVLAALNLQPLVDSIQTAAGMVIIALGVVIAAWLRSKAKTDTQRSILDQVLTFVDVEVRAAAQSIAPAMRAALADGKLTAE